MLKTRFILKIAIVSAFTFSALVTPTKAWSISEIQADNLACTQNLSTSFGQQAPNYCKSAAADSGIIFDQVNARRNSDRSINIDLRLFNRGSADALVEVYDVNGNLQDIKIIDGNRPPTGLLESGWDVFTEYPRSFFSRYPFGDIRRDLPEQNISVTIPSGGSVKITKSSNFAIWYNNAMLALEVAQMSAHDPEFTRTEETKKFVREFAKEFGSQAAINIFKSEPNLQSTFSLDFLDKAKLAEVLQKLVRYTTTIESDPSKNPILGALSDVALTGANYGLENIIKYYINPFLGSVATGVRIGGDTVLTVSKFIDIYNQLGYRQRSTVTLRDAVQVQSLEYLPDGNYYYEGPPSLNLNGDHLAILINKKDDTAIGIAISYMSGNNCFRGEIYNNTVKNIFVAISQLDERYYRSFWEFEQTSRSINIDSYYPRNNNYFNAKDSYRRLHQECIDLLSP